MSAVEGLRVLVVEDDPGDVMLIEEAFAERAPSPAEDDDQAPAHLTNLPAACARPSADCARAPSPVRRGVGQDRDR